MQPPELLGTFLQPLEENQINYFVTGSVASIFYGEPRLTHDIDIVIHLDQLSIVKMLSLFPLEEFYCPPEEVIQIECQRKPYGHFNLIHHKSGFKADIYTHTGDQLHQWAFSHRKRIELRPPVQTWLAPPEYIIIRKLEYFREGGSTKHLEDIRKMLPQVSEGLDKHFLEKELAARGLHELWVNLQKR